MGPGKAAELFKVRHLDARLYRVTLFGSLAATGKGHQTDQAIINALHPIETKIIWRPDEVLPKHSNGMMFEALGADSAEHHVWKVYSIGGGDITDFGLTLKDEKQYQLTSMHAILDWTQKTGQSFWEFVEINEGRGLYTYLRTVWKAMRAAIERGIEAEGILPGGLKLPARPHHILSKLNI